MARWDLFPLCHQRTPSTIVVCFFPFYGYTCGIGHMEAPRLGIKLELQLLAYATAAVMQALSQHHIAEVHACRGTCISLSLLLIAV